MEKVAFSVPAKIILSGDHAVVHGYPALVAAVDRRMFLELKVKNEVWEWKYKQAGADKAGMGSSAQYAVLEAAALSWIINKKMDREKISRIAHEIENLAHGTASGVDTTIVTYGGIILYQKGEKGLKVKKIEFKKIPKFLLVDTGRPVETTGEMVNKVSSRLKAQGSRQKTEKLLRKIGGLPENFEKALSLGDLDNLSNLITRNQRLLEELGVVGERAVRIIREIEKIGGAAKICGAGGLKKGSGIALVYHKDLDVVRNYCCKKKLDCFEVKLGGEGLKKEF